MSTRMIATPAFGANVRVAAVISKYDPPRRICDVLPMPRSVMSNTPMEFACGHASILVYSEMLGQKMSLRQQLFPPGLSFRAPQHGRKGGCQRGVPELKSAVLRFRRQHFLPADQ